MNKVRYISRKYQNLILYRSPTNIQLATDLTTGIQRSITIEPEIVQFENFEFITEDPDIIKWLDNHSLVTGKNAHICIERAAETDEVKNQLVALVTEIGEEASVEFLKRRAEKRRQRLQEREDSGKKKSKQTVSK